MVLGAETGSGKTLAYLLPVLSRMLAKPSVEAGIDEEFVDEGGKGDGRPKAGPLSRAPPRHDPSDSCVAQVLVLTPNQELAGQVLRVLDSLELGEEALGMVVAGAQGFPRGSQCKVKP